MDKTLGSLEERPHDSGRRHFLSNAGMAMGALATSSVLTTGTARSTGDARVTAGGPTAQASTNHGVLGAGHHKATAKRVIYLFQGGGPAQMELFDYKPELVKRHLQEMPPSVMGTSRLTSMSSTQSTFPLMKPLRSFAQHGESGAWVSDLLPYTARIVDELCFVRTVHTDPINHIPAVQFAQSGAQINGRPCIGAWVSYGLGTDNRDLPPFIVMHSSAGGFEQPIDSGAWSNGFLPSQHQGVRFLPGSRPVVFLENPAGLNETDRRRALRYISELAGLQFEKTGDPEIPSRVSQYDMAYRMQSSVPEAVDLEDEPESTFELYGPQSRIPGTFAYNCILARRLAERDVKFVQLYHRAWDHHDSLPARIAASALSCDQPSAALVLDLKRRGLLEDTLVVWGGEFGRTSYSQGRITPTSYGRDHHIACGTYWMAGGGVKAGHSHGETDEFSFRVVRDPVHMHDLHATLLHVLGIDHEKLTFRYQGRDFRLTDVHGKVIRPILA
jgi:hypothetical protein